MIRHFSPLPEKTGRRGFQSRQESQTACTRPEQSSGASGQPAVFRASSVTRVAQPGGHLLRAPSSARPLSAAAPSEALGASGGLAPCRQERVPLHARETGGLRRYPSLTTRSSVPDFALPANDRLKTIPGAGRSHTAPDGERHVPPPCRVEGDCERRSPLSPATGVAPASAPGRDAQSKAVPRVCQTRRRTPKWAALPGHGRPAPDVRWPTTN